MRALAACALLLLGGCAAARGTAEAVRRALDPAGAALGDPVARRVDGLMGRVDPDAAFRQARQDLPGGRAAVEEHHREERGKVWQEATARAGGRTIGTWGGHGAVDPEERERLRGQVIEGLHEGLARNEAAAREHLAGPQPQTPRRPEGLGPEEGGDR